MSSQSGQPSSSKTRGVELQPLSYETAVSLPYIAIEPPTARSHQLDFPPSFDSAQFDIVLRRQRTRPREGGGLKSSSAVPSRFITLSNAFEFAGWGTISHILLTEEEYQAGERAVRSAFDARNLGQFTASALAGNAVLGSVFYALPAVVLASSVYSPISLFIATLVLFLWRPVMEELASAFPISGAPYSYMLNVSSKSFALVGAALLLLDFTSTSVVSAATATSYIAGEVTLPFPVFVGTLLILVLFAAISMSGLKESARLAFSVLSLHILTMVVLVICAVVAWARNGSGQLRDNWRSGTRASGSSPARVIREIFNGICLGALGMTGFECVPSYVANIKPGRYPRVLRNLHYACMALNAPVMLLVFAIVPLDTVLGGANVLSILAEMAVGRWLRICVAIDATIVLCGGVLTGILSACQLFERLAHDRVIPKAFLLRLPSTEATYVSILAFLGFNGVFYAASAGDLQIVSKMFSLVWLTVMTLFPLSVLLLKFNRGRIPRDSCTSLVTVCTAFAVVGTVIGGNIAIDPSIAGYFAVYVAVILTGFVFTQTKSRLLLALLGAYDQVAVLHKWPMMRRASEKMIVWITRLRRQPVCLLTKTDEINHLVQMLLYVRHNEETSCVKLVHFYDERDGVPSEMEANWKILDEAFPEITVDLVLVKNKFTPANVAAVAHHLKIPTSLMFMSCPGDCFPHSAADIGARIICL